MEAEEEEETEVEVTILQEKREEEVQEGDQEKEEERVAAEARAATALETGAKADSSPNKLEMRKEKINWKKVNKSQLKSMKIWQLLPLKSLKGRSSDQRKQDREGKSCDIKYMNVD